MQHANREAPMKELNLDDVLAQCYHILAEEPVAAAEDSEYCACANQIKQLHAHESTPSH